MKTEVLARPIAFSNVSIDKWDRVFTLGPKVKDDDEVVIDTAACRTMIENFAKRQNDLGMDFEHVTAIAGSIGVPAPQLAYYNALCLVVDGAVDSFASHDPNLAQPLGSGMGDGLYAHRSEVTPLGDELLPNYRFISPMFVMDDKGEDGSDIGPNILNISAVSVPFQDGCQIQFSKNRITKITTSLSSVEQKQQEKNKMDEKELSALLGLADGASAEEMRGAMKKYMDDAAKKEEEYKRCFAELEEMKKKFSDGADKEPDGDEEAKEASALKKDFGLPETATWSSVRACIAGKTAAMTELVALKKELEDIKAKRAEEEKQVAVKKFCDEAIAEGRWFSDKRAQLERMAAADMETAKGVLFDKGVCSVMKIYTQGGQPIGKERSLAPEGEEGPKGAGFAEEAKKFSKEHNVDLATAQREVAKKFPELYDAYRNRQ